MCAGVVTAVGCIEDDDEARGGRWGCLGCWETERAAVVRRRAGLEPAPWPKRMFSAMPNPSLLAYITYAGKLFIAQPECSSCRSSRSHDEWRKSNSHSAIQFLILTLPNSQFDSREQLRVGSDIQSKALQPTQDAIGFGRLDASPEDRLLCAIDIEPNPVDDSSVGMNTLRRNPDTMRLAAVEKSRPGLKIQTWGTQVRSLGRPTSMACYSSA